MSIKCHNSEIMSQIHVEYAQDSKQNESKVKAELCDLVEECKALEGKLGKLEEDIHPLNVKKEFVDAKCKYYEVLHEMNKKSENEMISVCEEQSKANQDVKGLKKEIRELEATLEWNKARFKFAMKSNEFRIFHLQSVGSWEVSWCFLEKEDAVAWANKCLKEMHIKTQVSGVSSSRAKVDMLFTCIKHLDKINTRKLSYSQF